MGAITEEQAAYIRNIAVKATETEDLPSYAKEKRTVADAALINTEGDTR